MPITEPSTTPLDTDAAPGQAEQNVAAVQAFVQREEDKVGRPQRAVEWLCDHIGRPRFLAWVMVAVLGWVLLNTVLAAMGWPVPDPAPHHWLQGLLGLGALLISAIVLSKQSRVARLLEQRSHLDLTVALLTEQKVAKLINLIEELRRDLPDVQDRFDSEADLLQKALLPDQVIATLDGAIDKTGPA